MVAYSFKKRFVGPIQDGTKTQTIRSVGKRRHARPADQLQLYQGMRTRHCSLIRDATCHHVHTVTIHMPPAFGAWWIIIDGEDITERSELEAFARSDGFESWRDMQEFWIKEHKPEVAAGIFHGVLIGWAP